MFYRADYWVQEPLGPAVAGADVAVLTDPSNFSTQPGSPLAAIYAAGASNSASITAAVWAAQQITFSLNAVPADVVPGSWVGVASVSPPTFNSTLSAPWLVLAVNGLNVIVQALTNPGAYISGGTVATSVLPNPMQTDGNGHAFFYATSGLYGVQIYGPIAEQDYPDQTVGFIGGGSVTSVALTAPAQFAVGGSPVTTAGTLALTWATEAANLVLSGPATGAAAAPTFRALVAADIPSLTYVSSVALTLAVPGIFTHSVTGSPITGSGTLALTIGLATEAANTVWAGPTSGGSAQPTFRALVAGDLTALGALFYQTIESAGSAKPQEPDLNFLNAVIADNPGNTSTDVTIPGISAFTHKALGSPVSLGGGTITAIDDVAVTFPAKGGPWYVRISYFYAKDGGIQFFSWAQDTAGHKFAGAQGVVNTDNSAFYASGLSPVTYANSASSTFTIWGVDQGSTTVETDTSTEGTPLGTSIPSYMQVEVISAG